MMLAQAARNMIRMRARRMVTGQVVMVRVHMTRMTI